MPDAHYPINFVVKHPNLFVLHKKARPEAVEKPAGPLYVRWSSLFPNRRRSQVAAIGKQFMSEWWS